MKKFLIALGIILVLAGSGFYFFYRQQPAPEKITVKAFFNNSLMDPEISCERVFPVEREVPKTQAVARAALEELLKGVSRKEQESGFYTSLNPGVKINKLTIEDGVARVDFDKQMEFEMGGSCRVSAIRAQITETLKQFPSVQSVIISVEGRTEDILQP
jgi:spore germination protein GerM